MNDYGIIARFDERSNEYEIAYLSNCPPIRLVPKEKAKQSRPSDRSKEEPVPLAPARICRVNGLMVKNQGEIRDN